MKHKTLKKQLISQFYQKNKFAFSIAIFGTLVSASLNLILSWIMQQLIDTASCVPNALSLRRLTIISGSFILLCIAAFLISFLSKPRFIERAMRQYKDFAFQKLTEKSISSFHEEDTAGYLSALTTDAASIEIDYLSLQFTLFTEIVTFLGALTMMLFYSPLMTAAAIALTILPFAASLLTGNKLENAERRVSDRNTDFTSALRDCLAGFSVIKTFKAEKEILKLFTANTRALEHEKFTKQRIKAIVGMIGSVTGTIAQLGVFIVGTYLALSGCGLTPGVVIIFVNLMNFIIQPIAELPGLLASRKAAVGLIDKLAAALEKNPAPSGNTEVSHLSDGIRFKNVSFGYDKEKEILHKLSIFFEAGKSYAIVGSSGSGKSTLLNLLMASRPDYHGEILFDNTRLQDISTESLYEMISVIQQNVFIFNASIKDNITMFHSFPQQEIDDAIAHAHLNRLLSERGENCLCKENGKGLSGGEKQRISIARSLLKKSSILLADEVTAALDAQTAYQVTSDILDLDGITRIIVTHALDEALLRRYDGILVLKDGHIEENGVFDELMEKKGYFYALFTVAQRGM